MKKPIKVTIIHGPLRLCKVKCPGGHLCYKEPGHKGQHTCARAFGMRWLDPRDFPKTCCPQKEDNEPSNQEGDPHHRAHAQGG